MEITGCEFINVSAGRNGGAIYADMLSSSGVRSEKGGSLEIKNTLFEKNSADFGGAIVELGGNMEIYDSIFTDNTASENGGAIFTSHVDAIISNARFTNNRADETDGCGGAVYLDYETAKIRNSIFKDNSAGNGSAIYSLETSYKINGSQFKNNDIYTRLDRNGSSISDCG